MGLISEHHELEETFLFPELEKKLGKGVLHGNIDQHATFVPRLEELGEYIEAIKNDKQLYNGDELVEKVHSFSDVMVEHLVEVYFPSISLPLEG